MGIGMHHNRRPTLIGGPLGLACEQVGLELMPLRCRAGAHAPDTYSAFLAQCLLLFLEKRQQLWR